MGIFFTKRFTTLLSLFALLFLANSSRAQEVEEVLVTANKRGEQSIQDIAGNIQVLSSKTLERTLAEGFEDYIKMVPGLTSVSSGTGQSQIVIRGVNSARINHDSPQVRSLAGIYVDEMPISLAGFNPDLSVVDAERIEVLRGPQGTLYGASSMSGTIRIVTKQPYVEEFTGNISADTSTTQDGDMNYGIKGAANIPLSDRVAARISGFFHKKGGYIDNIVSGEDDYNDEKTVGANLKIAYYGDNLDASFAVTYNDLEADGRADEYLSNPTDPTLANIDNELETAKFVDDPFDNEFLGLNLTLNYDFEDVASATAAYSHFEVEFANTLDDTFRVGAFFPVPFNEFQNNSENTSDILEIRLISTYESPLQWVLGGYYESSEQDFSQTTYSPGFNAIFGVPESGSVDGALPNSIFDGTEDVETIQIATFGELSYNLTEALKLTFGFRWFEYDRDVDINAAGLVNGGVTSEQLSIEEDDWVHKVELTYDVGIDHMIYAIYSEGFRLGGVNEFVPSQVTQRNGQVVSCIDQLTALGATIAAPFSSDGLKNYEIGAKTNWLDNRLSANVGVFFNEFEDIQTAFALDCGFLQTINAGKIENVGVEGEFKFYASDALNLSFGFSYVDSEVTDNLPGLNADGDEPPYVPQFSASASIEYGVPVANGFGFIRGDLRHVGSSTNEFTSGPAVLTLDSYTVVDLTLGYEIGDWNFSLFSKNLFNDEIITNIDPDRIQPPQFSRGRPRTIGIRASKNL